MKRKLPCKAVIKWIRRGDFHDLVITQADGQFIAEVFYKKTGELPVKIGAGNHVAITVATGKFDAPEVARLLRDMASEIEGTL